MRSSCCSGRLRATFGFLIRYSLTVCLIWRRLVGGGGRSMSLLSNQPIARFAAQAASILFGVVIILQLLLAAGILPITMAWGGRQDSLTVGLRIASLASAVVLGLLAYVIRRRAGLAGALPIPMAIKVLSWVTTAFLALNTLGNLTSTSRGEKLLFSPITILLTVACLLVSLSRTET